MRVSKQRGGAGGGRRRNARGRGAEAGRGSSRLPGKSGVHTNANWGFGAALVLQAHTLEGGPKVALQPHAALSKPFHALCEARTPRGGGPNAPCVLTPRRSSASSARAAAVAVIVLPVVCRRCSRKGKAVTAHYARQHNALALPLCGVAHVPRAAPFGPSPTFWLDRIALFHNTY